MEDVDKMGLLRRRRRRRRRRAFVAGAVIGATVASGGAKNSQRVTEMDVELHCPKCGEAHSGKSKFCPQCGALLE